ncbi:MAG: ribonuclease HI family protein [Candidatus Omnitrophica bacterium]|jgi:ribonuclease HI|nr:ribonuclease HI family protein [Candidatus Omnitrophota bacterium]MDD5079158.1 ribonuclease HI family protein [Candidatus Omnitrophota bacterium]
MNDLEIFIDGASKGNPGPSGVGVAIYRSGKLIRELSSYIGEATNNIAEYTALIYALEEALILRPQRILIKTDSQLLYRQIKKIYKVKHPNMIGLYDRAVRLIGAFKEVELANIPREENSLADKLATQAVKEARAKGAN